MDYAWLGFTVLAALAILGVILGRIAVSEAIALISVISSALLGRAVWQVRKASTEKERCK